MKRSRTPKLKQYVKSHTHLNLTHLSTMATKIAQKRGRDRKQEKLMGRGQRRTSPVLDPTKYPKTTVRPQHNQNEPFTSTTQIEWRKTRSMNLGDTIAIHRRRTPNRKPMTTSTNKSIDKHLDLETLVCEISFQSLKTTENTQQKANQSKLDRRWCQRSHHTPVTEETSRVEAGEEKVRGRRRKGERKTFDAFV